MKPFWMLLIAVMVAGLGAWGCGDDDDDGTAGTDASPRVPSADTFTKYRGT